MKRDDDGAIIGLFIALAIIAVVVYLICLLAMVIVGVAAAGGTIFGGFTAVKNYFSSFKENIIDSNRRVTT